MASDRSSRSWVMQSAVVVSILAHASFLCAAGLHRKAAPSEAALSPAVDQWAGTTAAPVGAEELAEVDVAGSDVAGARSPVAPVQPAEAAPAPAKEKEAEAAPEKPAAPKTTPVKEKEPEEKVEKPTEKVAGTHEKVEPEKDEPADKQVAGTHDKQVAGTHAKAKAEPAKDDPEQGEDTNKQVAGTHEKVDSTTNKQVAGTDAHPTHPTKTPGGSPGATAGSFGAEGPASVRDLGQAFTRALPPACDSDPAWGKLDVGSQGAIEVAVLVSDEGKITGFEPISPNPKPQLLGALKRTLALLRAGVFSLKGGEVSQGRQILKLSVLLSDTPVTPEQAENAGAFGLASDWKNGRGVASFTQTSGRHVEITVEFLRVER